MILECLESPGRRPSRPRLGYLRAPNLEQQALDAVHSHVAPAVNPDPMDLQGITQYEVSEEFFSSDMGVESTLDLARLYENTSNGFDTWGVALSRYLRTKTQRPSDSSGSGHAREAIGHSGRGRLRQAARAPLRL